MNGGGARASAAGRPTPPFNAQRKNTSVRRRALPAAACVFSMANGTFLCPLLKSVSPAQPCHRSVLPAQYVEILPSPLLRAVLAYIFVRSGCEPKHTALLSLYEYACSPCHGPKYARWRTPLRILFRFFLLLLRRRTTRLERPKERDGRRRYLKVVAPHHW